jgi:hypothetical protein
VANPYPRPGFKDPRETAQESASTLSSYFQDKAAKQPKTVSPYSAPAGDAAGTAPTGGGPSTPSAPKGSAGGGTGFVSFGQYFGANAPAIQQQAQKQAVSAKGFEELNALQKPGGMEGSAFDRMLGGGVTQREAAKQGQYRFQQLGARLGEGPDMTLGGKAIEQSSAAQAANAKTQALDKKAQEIYGNYGDAALNRPWNELSEAEKAPYLYDANVALGY